MSSPASPPRRDAVERFASWLYTGPLGHLWSTAADLGSFAARSLLVRAGRRIGRDRAGPRRVRDGA